MAIQQVNVPDIGGAEGAEVIELLVAVGDEVSVDQGLIVLESDKASMEIPCTVAGKVVEVLVREGDKLAEGSPVVRVEAAPRAEAEQSPAQAGQPVAEDEQPPAPVAERPASMDPAPAPEPVQGLADAPTGKPGAPVPDSPSSPGGKAVAASPSAVAAASETPPGGAAYAGPAVRKLAREFGVPLDEVEGSGPHGRIVKEDLHRYAQSALSGVRPAGGAAIPAVPDIDFSAFGEVEVVARSRLDKLTAANMQRSWLNVPHVTQFDEADVTDLEAFRADLKGEAERRGTKLSPLPFVLKACAVALRDNPKLNSSLAGGGENLVYKRYIHIGMAVDTPAGLVVPVLRDVDRKNLWELAAEVQALAEKARQRKLTPGEMQGGCFTVSSLGNIGGAGFTPIVNTPEVGILGVSKAAVKPVWDGTGFRPRTLLPLALSYDHRVVNGGDGGRFLTRLVELLSDIRRLSL